MPGRIKLQTEELDICNGKLADVSPESWEHVVDHVGVLYVSASRRIREAGSNDVTGQRTSMCFFHNVL